MLKGHHGNLHPILAAYCKEAELELDTIEARGLE